MLSEEHMEEYAKFQAVMDMTQDIVNLPTDKKKKPSESLPWAFIYLNEHWQYPTACIMVHCLLCANENQDQELECEIIKDPEGNVTDIEIKNVDHFARDEGPKKYDVTNIALIYFVFPATTQL